MVENSMIVSFWGKGGVGKTTCSASYSIYLAKKGFKTLLITSDPTPSLSDIMGFKIGSEGRKVKGLSLEVVELDEEAVSSMWKEKFGEEVFRVISSFLPVDRSIIDYVAGAPGITEEFMLSYICDLNNNRSYDRIVWDTAPAGGTLRLLRIEEQFYKHLGEAAKLYLSFKGIIDKIRRGEKNPLEIIDSWRGLASRVLGLLSSDAFSAYVVTIPEWLGVAQTERIIRELEEFNINIEGIIVNQYEKGSGDSLKGKTKIHRKYLRMIEKKYQEAYKLVTIPMQPYEVRGVNQLHKFSRFLEKVDLAEG